MYGGTRRRWPGRMGSSYTNIPMSGVGRPRDEQIRQVLALFESDLAPVFIHCQYGCDRTGTVIACYRIQHGGWSSELALREAERHGISKLEYQMRKYILAFRPERRPDQSQASSN